MIKCLIFLGLVSYVIGSGLHYGVTGPLVTGIVNTGRSTQYRSQDNLGNYAFGYDEEHATGGTFRREAGNALGQVIGSYGLRDADGRIRIVNYVADDDGFRADIKTNEPGVEPRDPAATRINKPDIAIVAAVPAVQVVAPAPTAPIAQYTAVAPAPVAVKAAPAYVQAPVAVKAAPVVASPQLNIIRPSYSTPLATPAYAPRPVISNQIAVSAPVAAPAISPAVSPVGAKYIAQPAYLQAPAASVIQSPNNYLELANTYVHPASFGYSLGIPSTWGYTYILRKKK